MLSQVALLGPRVTTHLDTLTANLSKADAGASIRWRSRGVVRSSGLNAAQAATFNTVLKRVNVEKVTRVFTTPHGRERQRGVDSR